MERVTVMTKPRTCGPKTPRGERGLALVELMLLTVPVCVLSIVLASAIAATATAKNQSMWKASLKAQLAAKTPCGGVPLYALPATVPRSSQKQG
jgi:cytochrome c oxidase assembly factor CtaG